MIKKDILLVQEIYGMAKSLDEKGYTSGAIEKYIEVLESDPDFTEARIRLAYIYQIIGGQKSMQRELTEAFKRDPAAVIEYDNVFWGSNSFYEREMYQKRSIRNDQGWKAQIAYGWYAETHDIENYKIMFFKNEQKYYRPDIEADAEILIYKKDEEYPEYLLTRRRERDQNFYIFICRFKDGRQYNTGVINNYADEISVFATYFNTLTKELEI